MWIQVQPTPTVGVTAGNDIPWLEIVALVVASVAAAAALLTWWNGRDTSRANRRLADANETMAEANKVMARANTEANDIAQQLLDANRELARAAGVQAQAAQGQLDLETTQHRRANMVEFHLGTGGSYSNSVHDSVIQFPFELQNMGPGISFDTTASVQDVATGKIYPFEYSGKLKPTSSMDTRIPLVRASFAEQSQRRRDIEVVVHFRDGLGEHEWIFQCEVLATDSEASRLKFRVIDLTKMESE